MTGAGLVLGYERPSSTAAPHWRLEKRRACFEQEEDYDRAGRLPASKLNQE
jgi:hypothetical protein